MKRVFYSIFLANISVVGLWWMNEAGLGQIQLNLGVHISWAWTFCRGSNRISLGLWCKCKNPSWVCLESPEPINEFADSPIPCFSLLCGSYIPDWVIWNAVSEGSSVWLKSRFLQNIWAESSWIPIIISVFMPYLLLACLSLTWGTHVCGSSSTNCLRNLCSHILKDVT